MYNGEKYIHQDVLSILNQSFKNYEIIIINDCSIDKTEEIINFLSKKDKRIKIIKHNQNFGVYHSRIEAVLNSNGKYILFFDPDDMLLNINLFQSLFNYYLSYNLDIIEFIVYNQNEGNNQIYYSESQSSNHNHNFKKTILYQPELENIIFYKPNTKKYSMIICRHIWNKIYKRKIALKSINYIGNFYYNQNLIVADDTMINIINFHFAQNYSNIKIPGYLYIKKKNSMSRGYLGIKVKIKQVISFFYYFKFLYRYINEFNKDRNFIVPELNYFKEELIDLYKMNISNYTIQVRQLLDKIYFDKKSSIEIKKLINKINLTIIKNTIISPRDKSFLNHAHLYNSS